ncbi:unnamed protein product [Symbiodinium sp. KB8]|nr:unnamed protein product [Symbiodinium sp. KB8]
MDVLLQQELENQQEFEFQDEERKMGSVQLVLDREDVYKRVWSSMQSRGAEKEQSDAQAQKITDLHLVAQRLGSSWTGYNPNALPQFCLVYEGNKMMATMDAHECLETCVQIGKEKVKGSDEADQAEFQV